MKSTATLVLLSALCGQALSLAPPSHLVASRRASSSVHHNDYRRSVSPSSAQSAQVASSCVTPTSPTQLFAAAAISADDSYANIKYGPAITIGKLKINLFGALFGLWEIFWGVFYWYPAMTIYGILCGISSKLPKSMHFMEKIDPFRRVPICVAYMWGLLSMTIFGMWPVVEGRENLELIREVDEIGKKGKIKPAMYVANHCSWMDIPFVSHIFGFQNNKMIAKAELLKVPILGRACAIAGHVMLDRTNRRSQMKAFKAGVQWLKDGVNLVTFPEGTRSKTGRMGSFKKGAFKMAQSVGAPVVPMSILYADKVQPPDYAFPAKASLMRPRAVIKIGKPISTEGKSDDELLEEVYQAIADELPESQKPTNDTPAGV